MFSCQLLNEAKCEHSECVPSTVPPREQMLLLLWSSYATTHGLELACAL